MPRKGESRGTRRQNVPRVRKNEMEKLAAELKRKQRQERRNNGESNESSGTGENSR